MTKKLFLAAASVAAMAFAGGAHAGTISGHFGVDAAKAKFSPAASGGVKAVTYNVASERVVSATDAITGTITATNKLENSIVVGAASRDFLVSFTVTGATPTATSLVVTQSAGVPGDVSSSLVGVSNGVATYLVSVKDSTVTHFALKATVTQKAQAPIAVSGNVVAIIGGTNITVDTASSVTAAVYQPLLAALDATSNKLTAELPDYHEIGGLTAGIVLGQDFSAVNEGVFHRDLNATVVTSAAVLDGGVATVRGPLIDADVKVTLVGTVDASNTDANTTVLNLTAAQADDFVNGLKDLTISQTAGKLKAFRAGTYTVTWAPKAATGFTVPAASTADAGVIGLEGTNFVAPWVSGTGAATSVIRVSNSNSAASGAVTVRMISGSKVVNGVATPFVSTAAPLSLAVVPAQGDLQVTSAQLVAHFGDFTRGDFQVTINSDDAGFTAKMRNTRDGQTFEQSLSASDLH